MSDSTEGPPERLEISFDEEPAIIRRAAATSKGDSLGIVLRSAALLYGGSRVPIPREGLTIGSGALSSIIIDSPEAESLHATVETTEAGHVLVDAGTRGGTYLNGERLTRGERRPLERGDTIALAQTVFHYVPTGSPVRTLAPIAPVDAGRVRAAKDQFTIGRDPESDLWLDHPTVSRHHAIIRVDGGQTWIEDLGSAVGMRVNGIPLTRTTLAVGDQIAIGPFRIVFDGEDLIERGPAKGLAVSAVGIAVSAGGRSILQPTSLQMRPGELVAIIGESGAGKSTLLKALAGVSTPTSGRVLAGGEALETRLAEIGYVPQFDTVHGALTVVEALGFAAQLRLPVDLAVSEREERVREVMAQLQLADRGDTRVGVLSGGQRKRVAVGTELLHEPGVLFLDEPTTGLDPGLERRLMELFRKIANGGKTVALVTHATGSIALCDRVLVMGSGGRLLFDGTPDELLVAFSVSSFETVYDGLADASPRLNRPSSPHLPPIERSRQMPLRQPFGFQTRVLAFRYAMLMRRDRRHLRSALVQVPILGLLTATLFHLGVFAHPGASGSSPGKASQLIFLMVTVALWLGSINAAREIVKEVNVIRREAAVGVSIRAYIASKLIVLLTFSSVQTLLFSLIVLLIQPLHESPSSVAALFVVLTLTSWLAVLLGLLVSAAASSEDHATAIIPLLLVPQLLLGGAIQTLHDMSGGVRVVASLIPSRWAFAAAGTVVHLNNRIFSVPEAAQLDRYGHHFFVVSLPAYVLVATVFAAAFLFALQRLIERTISPEALSET